MNDGSPPIPGFRSLSQAGIRLQEGLATPTVSEATIQSVKAGSQDPNWPPMPTLAQKEESGTAAPNSQKAGSVVVQPREPGIRRSPGQEHPPVGGKLASAPPVGEYVRDLPTLRFTCPNCAVVLTIPDPKAYNGEPAPCPHCSAVILPPRVVSPFAVVPDEALRTEEGRRRHYAGYSL